jgi:subtilisin family serine protease
MMGLLFPRTRSGAAWMRLLTLLPSWLPRLKRSRGYPTTLAAPGPALARRRYFPSLDTLEDRLPPGDLLAGLWQTAFGSPNADSWPQASASQRAELAYADSRFLAPLVVGLSDRPVANLPPANAAIPASGLDTSSAEEALDFSLDDPSLSDGVRRSLPSSAEPERGYHGNGAPAIGWLGDGSRLGAPDTAGEPRSLVPSGQARADGGATDALWQAVRAQHFFAALQAPSSPGSLLRPTAEAPSALGAGLQTPPLQPAPAAADLSENAVAQPASPRRQELPVNFTADSFPVGALVYQLLPGTDAALEQLVPSDRLGSFTAQPTDIPGLFRVSGDGADLARLATALAHHPLVDYVDAVHQARPMLLPNDPHFTDGSLWGLSPIQAPIAWDVSTGTTAVVIAHIDTGADYTHPDLYRNIWINQQEIPPARLANLTDTDPDGVITFWDLNNPVNQGVGKITDLDGNGYIDGNDLLYDYNADGTGGWADNIDQDDFDSNPNTYRDDLIGWNFVNNSNSPWDDYNHGTHTAGTLGAIGNNGVGVTGMLWQARIMVLKFIDASGMGQDTAAAAAIRYAAIKGARVSNNSWGESHFSMPIYDAINFARMQGHVLVAAAGNAAVSTDTTPLYPASFDLPNIIAVAALSGDVLAGFSSYGATTVDLAAPGEYIFSTIPGGYGYWSGTSMATPLVAGVAALILGRHPTWTNTQVINRILTTTVPLPALEGRVVTGGRLNAADALDRRPVLAAIPDQLSTAFPGSVSVTLSATDADGDPLAYSGQAGNLAGLVRQRLGLFFDTSFYQDFLGLNEKWLRGANQSWYYILPNGHLYFLNPLGPNPLVARLDPSYWANPNLLLNAVPGPSTATFTVAGSTLTVRPNSGVTGSFGVAATASDGLLSDVKFFTVQVVGNLPPVLAQPSNQTIPSSQTVLTVPLSATDPEGDPITLSASGQSLAYVLDQQYDFFTSGDFYVGVFGANEKWVQSAAIASGWAFILPNGELRAWDGSGSASGPLLGNVGRSYHDDPNRLINVPVNQPRATLSILGSTLTITRDPAWISAMVITVTASDGMGSDSRTFTVTVTV